MSKEFEAVQNFNEKLLKIKPRELGEQPYPEFILSCKQMLEEIDEYQEAYKTKDFIGQIDAIIDLQYFAFGVLYKMGLTSETYTNIFSAVHNANMLKVAGINEKRGDHGAVDASKPDAWVNPEITIARILDEQ